MVIEDAFVDGEVVLGTRSMVRQFSKTRLSQDLPQIRNPLTHHPAVHK